MLPAPDGGPAVTQTQQATQTPGAKKKKSGPKKFGNVEYAYRYFISKGLSAIAAAGIVGNLKAESGVDPTRDQAGNVGRGIAQWSAGGRWDQLLAWAQSKGLDPRDLDTQLQYVWRELNGPYSHVLSQLRSAGSVQQATAVVLHDYESPADQSASVVAFRTNLANDTMAAHPERPLPSNAVWSGRTGGGSAGSYGSYDSGGSGGGPVARDKLDPQQLAADAGWEYDFLKTVPELWHLFQEAVKKDWSAAKFASAVKNTNWYSKHGAEARQNLVSKKVDHATWLADRDKKASEILDAAAQMGASLSPKKATQMAEHAMMMGWQVGDAQLTDLLAKHIHRIKGEGFQGEAGVNEDYLASYATDMGVNMSKNWIKKAVIGMANGDLTQQDVQDHVRKLSLSAFPAFRDELESNPQWTMKDVASPYLNSYATILEKNPAEVSLMTPSIRKALTTRDDKGKANPMSLYEYEQSLRGMHEYGKTSQGYQDIMGSTVGLLKDWGLA